MPSGFAPSTYALMAVGLLIVVGMAYKATKTPKLENQSSQPTTVHMYR